MRKIVLAAVAGVAVGLFQGVVFASGVDEAKEHGCVKCHDVEKKKVGPPWKEVSAKYKGKSVDEVVTAMKGKPVHKPVLKKTEDSSLKTIFGDYVLKQ